MQDMRVGMKPGESFKIRLLPREIMVCAAIVQLIAPEVPNLSLAQVVRIALTELCDAAVKCGLVPEQSEFDYEQSISKYRRGTIPRALDLARKVQTSRVIFQEQMERVSAGGRAAFGKLSLADQSDAAALERTLAAVEQDDPKAGAQLRRDLSRGRAKVSAVTPTTTPRKRSDLRKLRYDELKFHSEQDPSNMSAAEFKEMRQLERELTRGSTAQTT